jgi:hypothetical protein
MSIDNEHSRITEEELVKRTITKSILNNQHRVLAQSIVDQFCKVHEKYTLSIPENAKSISLFTKTLSLRVVYEISIKDGVDEVNMSLFTRSNGLNIETRFVFKEDTLSKKRRCDAELSSTTVGNVVDSLFVTEEDKENIRTIMNIVNNLDVEMLAVEWTFSSSEYDGSNLNSYILSASPIEKIDTGFLSRIFQLIWVKDIVYSPQLNHGKLQIHCNTKFKLGQTSTDLPGRQFKKRKGLIGIIASMVNDD